MVSSFVRKNLWIFGSNKVTHFGAKYDTTKPSTDNEQTVTITRLDFANLSAATAEYNFTVGLEKDAATVVFTVMAVHKIQALMATHLYFYRQEIPWFIWLIFLMSQRCESNQQL